MKGINAIKLKTSVQAILDVYESLYLVFVDSDFIARARYGKSEQFRERVTF